MPIIKIIKNYKNLRFKDVVSYSGFEKSIFFHIFHSWKRCLEVYSLHQT